MKSSRTEDISRYKALSTSKVVPDPYRCVQCGICSYNCPLGLDVRWFAGKGLSIDYLQIRLLIDSIRQMINHQIGYLVPYYRF